MSDQRLPDRGQGDYQYLVSLDDRRALSKIRIAENITGRLIERDSRNDASRNNIGMILVRTLDGRGPISGLSGDLMHATEWQYPFEKSWLGRVAIRYHHAKGVVKMYNEYGYETNVYVEVKTGMTMTEMKNNPGELRSILEDAAAEEMMATC